MCNEMRWGLVLTFVCLVTAGCSGKNNDLPEVVPVSGVVTLDSKPLTNATVTFIPSGATRGGVCMGSTNGSGQYELLDREGRKGAPVGEFKVTCTKWVMPDGKDFPKDSKVSPLESNARELLLPCYSNDSMTELKATVPIGGTTVDFQLKSRR